MTKEQLRKQREWRLKHGNKETKKYEKTINGFLMRAYRNMKSRVTGVQKLKSHLYLGLELLDKELFYKFSKCDKQFNNLFNNWENSNYNRKLTPSIDRIDSSRGYFIGNIRWLTHSENSKLGNISKNLTKHK